MCIENKTIRWNGMDFRNFGNKNFSVFGVKIVTDDKSNLKTPWLIFITILTYVLLSYIYNTECLTRSNLSKNVIQKNIKYILLWTKENVPLTYLAEGNSVFDHGKCRFTNCFLTSDKSKWVLTDFSAIVFGGLDLSLFPRLQLPSVRSQKQKYIFVASESSHRFPVCKPVYEDFFNWTWTYRVDSDIFWRYLTIYDDDDKVIGPSINITWLKSLGPINEELKMKLSKKSKAAAWFVSHCYTEGGRERYVRVLRKHLQRFGWSIDVYGECGNLSCPRTHEAVCFKKLERDYYFYLAFENSLSEDYVTEKLLNALNSYAVPIVYGAANYSRFLPPGSYLNARVLGPRKLANQINDIIRDKTKYYNFFRWRHHYYYRESSSSDKYCKLCEMLNDEVLMSRTTIRSHFRVWWNGRHCNKRKIRF